ncbi:MAG: hypothetical protein IPF54_14885 [Draconibacterium sp.]|nr:hypothetical protein [Draconibacterium sp.]
MKVILFDNHGNILRSTMRQVIFLILSILTTVTVTGQTTSFSLMAENPKFSQQTEDSIFNNNPLCLKYVEMAKADTFYWDQFASLNIDSIALLHKRTANELFNQTLDFKQSCNYSGIPFNLLGTYYETEYKNDTSTLQNIKTKIKVFDEGFTSGKLVNASTQECEELYKSPDFHNSLFDSYMLGLGGNYSNLYYLMDLDFFYVCLMFQLLRIWQVIEEYGAKTKDQVMKKLTITITSKHLRKIVRRMLF